MVLKFSMLLLTIAFFSQSYAAIGSGEYELWKKGRGHWYQNEWEEAAEAFKALIENYPESPRRCKSENFLGYCYHKLGKKAEAFDTFSNLIENQHCKSGNVDDAKFKRLQIAFETLESRPEMRQVLIQGLQDPNIDIRLSAAVWLSKLDDPAGIEVFFQVLQTETDQDRRDTATQHILKLGSGQDKERLQNILEEYEKENSGKKPKMVRLIIRDLSTNDETVKVNMPIGLFSVVIQSLSDEQLLLIKKQADIDLRNLKIDLQGMPSGTVLFQVIDGSKQEIKLFLE